MSIILSLKQNFIWAFVGNALSAFFMWLLLVVLTKEGNVESVGVFAVAQAVGLPITLVFSLKLQSVQVTDAKDEFNFGNYLSLRLVTTLTAVIVTAAVGVAFYSYETAMIIFLMGISYAVVAIRETFLGVMQKSERMDRMTLSRVLESGSSLVLFGLLYFLTRSLALSVIGLIISRLAVMFLYDMPIAERLLTDAKIKFQPLWDRHALLKLFKVAAPLGLVALCTTLFLSIPRLVLDKYQSKAQVGYFAAISSLLVIGTMVVMALSQTSSPRLAKYFVENIRAYKLLILKLTGMAIALGIFGVAASYFFGRWILAHMFKPEYSEYNSIFVMMTAAGAILFLYTFMNDSLAAARKFHIQLVICVLAAGMCLITSLTLIPKYGMQGAALSTLACYLVGFLGSFASVICIYRKRVIEIRQATNMARQLCITN